MGHNCKVTDEFVILMNALWAGQHRLISPKYFEITIVKINEHLAGHNQQDSQETLFLVNGLHDYLNKANRQKKNAKRKITIILMT